MIWNAFAIAVREIGRNLTRAFLTVLGIFIGVASIITMVTLGEGATLAVKAQSHACFRCSGLPHVKQRMSLGLAGSV